MKYFSLFENATCIKNRLDQVAVNFLGKMSNKLIDEQDVKRYRTKRLLNLILGLLCAAVVAGLFMATLLLTDADLAWR